MQNPTSFYNFYTQQKILLPKNILTGNHLLSQMNTNQTPQYQNKTDIDIILVKINFQQRDLRKST